MGKPELKVTIDKNNNTAMIHGIRMVFRKLWEENIYQGVKHTRQPATFEIPKEDIKAFQPVIDLAYGVQKTVVHGAKNVNDGAKNARFVRSNYVEGALNFKVSNDSKYPAAYYDHRGQRVRNPGDTDVESRILYAGCYVNIKVGFQPNPAQKGIWSNLLAIQFAADGEPVGGMSDAELGEGFGEVQHSFAHDENEPTSDINTSEDTDDIGDIGGENSNNQTSESDIDDLF